MVTFLRRTGVLLLLPPAILAGLMTACSQPMADVAEGRPAVLRLADTGIEGMEELNRSFGPFTREMERLMGIGMEFFPVSDRTAAVTALQFKQVDLVLTGPSEYLAMRKRFDVKPVVGVARPRYHTVFVVKADSPIQTLQDLRGKSIALKDPGSTTGHIMPVVMLKRAGLDPDRDVTLRMLDGTRIEALVNDDVDALGSGVRDYDRLVARFGEGHYRIIAESPPMPPDLIVARPGLSADVVGELTSKIMADGDHLIRLLLSGTNRDRYEVGAAFRTVEDADFDIVREGYDLLGLAY